MNPKILEPPTTGSRIVKANISLSGLSCMSCVQSIENALQRLQGVIVPSIHASLSTNNVILGFDKSLIDIEKITKVIQDLGYHIEDVVTEDIVTEESYVKTVNTNNDTNNGTNNKTKSIVDTTEKPSFAVQGNETITVLTIGGMSCASCIKTIQTAIELVPGVASININLLTTQATIKHDPNRIGSRDLMTKIEEIGYEPQLYAKGPSNKNGNSIRQNAEKEQRKMMKRFLISLIFAIPTFFITMIFMMVLPETNPIHMALDYQIIPGLEVNTLILFIFATPVQFILGYPFYVKGIRSIWYSHQANMDTLVAVGTTVAYIGSLLNVSIPIAQRRSEPGQQFFETSVFLITFIYLGRWLEARAKGKTFETITKLMELQPESATLLTITLDKNNHEVIEEHEISLELVQ
ncbi:9330_t:CDS:1, partial [Racocetra fulgida]